MGLVDDLRSPLGRERLAWAMRRRARPLSNALVVAHRRTLSRDTPVVVVTGSLGKTTTTRALNVALGRRVGRAEANKPFGQPLMTDFLRRNPWQPIALEVVLNRPGQLGRQVRVLRPTIAVVTSVGTEHMRSFPGGIDAIRDEKANAVRILPPTGVAILNGDDPNVRSMAAETRARSLFCGLGPDNDIRATGLQTDGWHGARMVVHAGGREYPVRSRLLGRQMTFPVLAAAALALALGREVGEALARVEQLRPSRSRLDPRRLPSGAVLIRDEFKGSVESVHSALDVLGDVRPGRRILVLGGLEAPPAPERLAYRAVAEHAAEVADLVLVVGTHLKQYWPGLRDRGFPRDQILHANSVADAIDQLRRLLQAGDTVLVKGRSNRKLARITLALSGREVGCALAECFLDRQYCDTCRHLRHGPYVPPIAAASAGRDT